MKSSENILRAKSKKYQHSFQPIYYVLRFVGLWPFTINYNPNGSIKGARVSIFDGFWFIIAICLYLISLFYTCEFMKHQDPHKSNYLSELLFYLSQIPTLLLGGVNVVLDMFNRKSIVNVLQKFITFDNKVGLMITMNTHNHKTITFWIIVWSFAFEYFFHNAGIHCGISFNYKNEKRRVLLYILVPTLIVPILLVMNVILFESNSRTSLNFLRWAAPQLLRSTECISVARSFAIFIRSLYIRFAALNFLLRSHNMLC